MPARTLTAEQARTMRERAAAGEGNAALAAAYDVTEATVSMILRGRTWKDAGGPTRAHAHKLTRQDAQAIRARRATGETPTALAHAYQVSLGHVCNIINGRHWA